MGAEETGRAGNDRSGLRRGPFFLTHRGDSDFQGERSFGACAGEHGGDDEVATFGHVMANTIVRPAPATVQYTANGVRRLVSK